MNNPVDPQKTPVENHPSSDQTIPQYSSLEHFRDAPTFQSDTAPAAVRPTPFYVRFRVWFAMSTSHKIITAAACAAILLAIVLAIVIPVTVHKRNSATMNLSGKELLAYNMIVAVSDDFKNPDSVRILSGSVYVLDSNEIGYFKLSAHNSYGSRVSGYYTVFRYNGKYTCLDLEDIYEEDGGTIPSDILSDCLDTDDFDLDKVNEALAKKWKNFN